MDTPQKLPGLTGKTEAQLREIYTEHIGGEPGAEFDTIPKLTAEIKRAYAEKHPEPAKAAVLQSSTDVTKIDSRSGLEHSLPQATWDALSPVELKHFDDKATKPAELS